MRLPLLSRDHRRRLDAEFNPWLLPNLIAGYDSKPTYLTTHGAQQLASASSQYLSIAAAPNDIGANHYDYTVAGWVYLDTVGANRSLFEWGDATTTPNYWYRLFYSHADLALKWDVNNYGNDQAAVTAAVSAATRVFVVAYCDETNDEIGISINGGAFTTAAFNPDAHNAPVAPVFYMGREIGGTSYHNGWLDSFGFWSRVLTSDEVTSLYNSGRGKQYADLSGSIITSLVSWWDLHENNGACLDAVGSNDLTRNASPTTADGILGHRPVTGCPITTWADRGPLGLDATQTASANRPIFNSAAINGGSVEFDDTYSHNMFADDVAPYLSGDDIPYTLYVVFKLGYTGTTTKTLVSLGHNSSFNQIDSMGRLDNSNKYNARRVDDSASAQNPISSETEGTSAARVMCSRFDGSIIQIYRDGTALTLTGTPAGNYNVGTCTFTRFGIGTLRRPTLGNYWDGYIKAILLFSEVHSDTTRQKIEEYLMRYAGL